MGIVTMTQTEWADQRINESSAHRGSGGSRDFRQSDQEREWTRRFQPSFQHGFSPLRILDCAAHGLRKKPYTRGVLWMERYGL